MAGKSGRSEFPNEPPSALSRKTAKAMGLNIPVNVLALADELIE